MLYNKVIEDLNEIREGFQSEFLKEDVEKFLSTIWQRGALAGLALAFTGDLRARLFEF